MKVGDLVIRKVVHEPHFAFRTKYAEEQRSRLGCGIILSKQMAGSPAHSCITVLYPKVGEVWDVAESLMEIIKGKNDEYSSTTATSHL